MAKLRTATDAAFWDLNIASSRNLDGRARAVPGDQFPMDNSCSSKVHRAQQLSLLTYGFPLGAVPSISPPATKELGSFCLQSILVKASVADWWFVTVGQFRPMKLISWIKSKWAPTDKQERSSFRDMVKLVFDKSLFSGGMFSRIPVTPSSSLLVNLEGHGDRKGGNFKLVYDHELPGHDIKLEAAWPELFVDNKGNYWNVPGSISLGLASHKTESGLSYRCALHTNSGRPQALNGTDVDAPPTLLPGLWAKAAVSYEKTKDLWRPKVNLRKFYLSTKQGPLFIPSYDDQLKESHSSISAIIGGRVEAGPGRKEIMQDSNVKSKIMSHLCADLYGSLCFTLQLGQYRKNLFDLTRVDARLDIRSASAFADNLRILSRNGYDVGLINPESSARLGLIFQQQVIGPILFRVDAKCAIDGPEKQNVRVEDVMYSVNYGLRMLQSGKVVAWYSPRRKEGMVELRLYEFN